MIYFLYRYAAYFAKVTRGSKNDDSHNNTYSQTGDLPKNRTSVAQCLGKLDKNVQ